MNTFLTRERLLEIIVTGPDASGAEQNELARIALAAMDSEPVADVVAWSHPTEERTCDIRWRRHDVEPGPLYRHAQQPVVPEVMYWQDAPVDGSTRAAAYATGWNACRAAMLQAQSDDDGEPTDDERIMAIEGIHNCERCSDEGWVIGEMGITRCACGQAGNSPAILGAEQRIADAVELLKQAAPAMLADNGGPDGPLVGRLKSPVIPDGSMAMLRRWLAFGRGMQNAGSQLPRNLIAETEEMLAAAPQEVSDGK